MDRIQGVCDRCGFAYRLTSLRELVVNQQPSGLLVCRECHEEDHPQHRVATILVHDPEAIRNPRPDTPSGDD